MLGSLQSFGMMSDYRDRNVSKHQSNHQMPEKPLFFAASSRPGNFGDHIDFKATIDNWFDENRVYNEH